MWILLLVAFLVVATLVILNGRARSRLERLGAPPEDPTRRFSWMSCGG